MEESNNKLLLKGLAILLIAILGLTVYRTETTKRDVAKLSKSVEALSSRLDSISQDGVPQAAVPAGQSVSKKQFNDLSKAVSVLESKVANMTGVVDRLSRSHKNAGSEAKPTTSSSTSSKSTAGAGRISISAKGKAEDRYIRSSVLPEITKGPEGVVIIAVKIGNGGNVVSARVNEGTTIADEDILDACKEAALRTYFSINMEVPNKQQGTITYTFTAK